MKAKGYLVLFLVWMSTLLNVKAADPVYFKVPINLAFPENQSMELAIRDRYQNYNDNGVLILPDSYTSQGRPTRLVYCAHGAGGGVDSSSWFLQPFAIIDSLVSNGYAVFDVNGGPSFENMGGSWVMQSAFKAYGYIKEHYNVYDEIFVIGFSMGGLTSTNFVYKHPSFVLAHGMMSPVLTLKEQAWENPWYPSTRKSIAQAYNFSDLSGKKWEEDKITGWDPLYVNTFCQAGDTLKFYPVPVKVWHGSRDQLVEADASLKFQRFIRNAQGYCELRLIDSDDHGLSVGSPSIDHELLLFFKRFEY